MLIPSVDFRRQDVGGAGSKQVTGNPTAHGARSEDAGTTLNGMTLASFGTGAATSTLYLNPMGLQEITIDSGSNDASLNAGGVRTNYTLREGGNQFHGVVFAAYAPGSLQSNNLTQDLINRGLAAPICSIGSFRWCGCLSFRLGQQEEIVTLAPITGEGTRPR